MFLDVFFTLPAIKENQFKFGTENEVYCRVHFSIKYLCFPMLFSERHCKNEKIHRHFLSSLDELLKLEIFEGFVRNRTKFWTNVSIGFMSLITYNLIDRSQIMHKKLKERIVGGVDHS